MFKNATIFRLDQPTSLSNLEVAEGLQRMRFTPCGALQARSAGWVPPYADAEAPLVDGVGPIALLCVQIEDKILPAAAINDEVEKRAAAEQANGVEVGKTWRKRLRQMVVDEFLAKALTRKRRILGFVDTIERWVVIDTSSQRIAEDWLSLLRDSLGSFPATPPRVAFDVARNLTHWLYSHEPPEGLLLGHDCQINALNDDDRFTLRSTDLHSPVVVELIDSAEVVSLALQWRERLSFTLTAELGLRKLRYLGIEPEPLSDPRENFEAEMLLSSGELRALLRELPGWFGGLVIEIADAASA